MKGAVKNLLDDPQGLAPQTMVVKDGGDVVALGGGQTWYDPSDDPKLGVLLSKAVAGGGVKGVVLVRDCRVRGGDDFISVSVETPKGQYTMRRSYRKHNGSVILGTTTSSKMISPLFTGLPSSGRFFMPRERT